MISSRNKKKGAKEDRLPVTIFVGDRVRIMKRRMHEIRVACEAAGYVTNLEAPFIIVREDSYGTGGRRRLFTDRPPWAFYPLDVELAWNSDDERRAELKKRGHI